VAKKAGNKIKATGIKNLKLWSNVNEIDIQYKLNKKYPNPKNHPYLKKGLLIEKFFLLVKRKIKNKEKVIKLIKK
tara:strand:- start:381 stop:605 length:225 start_codon:yes stop_codon:yes gene_type:complete